MALPKPRRHSSAANLARYAPDCRGHRGKPWETQKHAPSHEAENSGSPRQLTPQLTASRTE
ncbi:unnamed protein product, partial [Nesidiocoris tenuis]